MTRSYHSLQTLLLSGSILAAVFPVLAADVTPERVRAALAAAKI